MPESATQGSAAIRIGQGRYRLGQRLATGGSSDVYRAEDTVLQRPVAVKIFRACADPAAERRFQDEAKLIAQLSHPALVTIYDTGFEDGRAYQVLQLVEGPTLRDRLVDGPLESAEVVAIGIRLAGALAYVHARGIVHRDVKPSNVLGNGDHVYLADFGISRLLDSVHLTASGLAVGTAAYMAPEQVRGDEVGPAADVYSLGLVLLECFTGHREYPGGVAETAMARLSRPPLVPTWLPAPLPSLLAAMTRDDAGERPSADACATSLRDGVPLSAAPLSTTAALPAAADPQPVDADTLVAPALGPPAAGIQATGKPPAAVPPATDSLGTTVPAGDASPSTTVPAGVSPGDASLGTTVPAGTARPGTTPALGDTSSTSMPADGDRRRAARAALAAIAVALALVIGVLVLADDKKPGQAPAETNPTPTAPRSGAPTQSANPDDRTGSTPRVVAPPASGKPSSGENPPAATPSPPQASTEPSTEPSQEPTEEPSAPPSSGGDDDGDNGGGDGDGSSGPGPGGNGSNSRGKGRG